MDFDGRITANLKIGKIDKILEALRVPGTKNQLIPGLRSMKEFCILVATGLTDGSTVQVLYAILKLVLKQMPTVPPYPAGQRELNSTRARNRVQRLWRILARTMKYPNFGQPTTSIKVLRRFRWLKRKVESWKRVGHQTNMTPAKNSPK